MNFDYVLSARAFKSGQFQPEPGPVSFLRVPSTAPVPLPEHRAIKAREIEQWFDEVRDLADGDQNICSVSEAGDVLVWVHGYNNSLEIIMQRQRQLAKDLAAEGWRGVVVGFDWPSDDNTLNYLEDRSDAAAVAEYLVSDGIVRLVARQKAGCVTNVHLLGHSTGAYVILEAFAAAQKRGSLFKADWRIAQVAFIGGDVAASSLAADSEWAAPMFARCMRLTNYSNPFDKVLGVSNAKRLGVSPRAGRVGLPEDAHPKAVNVDCGEYFVSLDPSKQTHFGTFNHSWHIGNRVFARDLAMALEGGIDRNTIPTRSRRDNRLVLQNAPRPVFQGAW